MILLGSVVNGGAVVVGGLVGMFVGKLLPERLRTAVMAALSLMTVGSAVPGLLKSNNALIPIISMVVGTLIGELLDIDSAVNKLGEKLQKRFSGSRVTEGFVTGSLVFAVGALAVMGPLGLTAACLLLMFCSRKAMYPWAISIFTLALPVLLLLSNVYPN